MIIAVKAYMVDPRVNIMDLMAATVDHTEKMGLNLVSFQNNLCEGTLHFRFAVKENTEGLEDTITNLHLFFDEQEILNVPCKILYQEGNE
jgi:hypothetical protein